AADLARQEASVSLAEALLREGDAQIANRRPAQAKESIRKSFETLRAMHLPTLRADLSLLDAWHLSPPPLLTLRGHTGQVTSVAVSTNGPVIVSGGGDGTIRLWSYPLGRQETVWQAHVGGVTCLAVSPDGKLCISGGADGKFRVWDLEKKNLVNTIDGHGGKIISLSLSRGGDTMASLTSGHMIRVWELPTFEISKEINGDTDRISAITISPDGRQILAGSENGGVTIVNLDDAR